MIADRILRIAESETLAMTKKARALKAEGKDVISLSIGEPDFDTPAHIIEAAKTAMDQGHTHYPPVSGIPELRQAVSDKFKRENGLDFSPEQVVVSTGAKHSLMNVVLSVVNPGDEVIIPVPYWVSYAAMVEFAGGTCVYLPTTVQNDFKPSPEQVEAAITPRTRAFLFSSPCNPSGSVFTETELKALAAVFARHPEILIISDEIYEHINFSGKHHSIAAFPEIKERCVVVNGVSKGYAMTGWRIGYIGAPKAIADACEKIQGQFTSGANTIAQWAAVAALNGPLQPSIDMTATFLRRRDLVIRLASEIPGIHFNRPGGAFYLFPEVSSYFGKRFDGQVIQNADDLCMYLLNEGLVATVPGTAFGDPSCIRLSFATSEDLLEKAFERMKTALGKLV